jgi:hypothetical protein
VGESALVGSSSTPLQTAIWSSELVERLTAWICGRNKVSKKLHNTYREDSTAHLGRQSFTVLEIGRGESREVDYGQLREGFSLHVVRNEALAQASLKSRHVDYRD